ncbi:MAG: hypothetical protein ACOVP2_04625, partial [Armatimonadaceae bacterium]
RLKCPAPGPPAPHSTGHRAVMFVRAGDEMRYLFTAPLMPFIKQILRVGADLSASQIKQIQI